MIIFPPDINYIESNDTKVAPDNEIKSAAPSSADPFGAKTLTILQLSFDLGSSHP